MPPFSPEQQRPAKQVSCPYINSAGEDERPLVARGFLTAYKSHRTSRPIEYLRGKTDIERSDKNGDRTLADCASPANGTLSEHCRKKVDEPHGHAG